VSNKSLHFRSIKLANWQVLGDSSQSGLGGNALTIPPVLRPF